MTAPIARALMSLAGCCLGESRREWTRAMEAEFEIAVEDGHPFAFAAGCLIAACQELPRHAEGRLALANHLLALGLLIPMAVFQVSRGLGAIAALIGPRGITAGGALANPYLIGPQFSAIPVLLILWLLLGIGHLRLSWVLVERDWDNVVKVSALIAAATITLFMFMSVLFLDLDSLVPQFGALGLELAFILAAARSHARLLSRASNEPLVFTS